ncbi:MAG: endonuclease domain-containing protein [Anaerolineales bacterium]
MKNNYPRLQDNPQLRRRMTEIARDFRKEPTKSEAKLWQALRGKKLDGIKFRRQQPVGPFIVDFYNSVYRLVIEIDGSIHDSQFEADKNRQNILEELGLNILRISAELVEKDVSSVLEIIRMKIKELQSQAHESPSPILGVGRGGG